MHRPDTFNSSPPVRDIRPFRSRTLPAYAVPGGRTKRQPTPLEPAPLRCLWGRCYIRLQRGYKDVTNGYRRVAGTTSGSSGMKQDVTQERNVEGARLLTRRSGGLTGISRNAPPMARNGPRMGRFGPLDGSSPNPISEVQSRPWTEMDRRSPPNFPPPPMERWLARSDKLATNRGAYPSCPSLCVLGQV